MKSFACLNRVAGYGKQKLPDERVRQAQGELLEQIRNLRQRLSGPLQQIAGWEEREAQCIAQERRRRRHTEIVGGRRLADPATEQRLKAVVGERSRCRREIQRVEARCGKDLQRLRDSQERWLHLQGKDEVYRIDVELDQILTYFRVALVNLSSWFLSECLGNRAMSLTQFLHTILLLPGEMELSAGRQRITLERNAKDPATMTLLAPALERLNRLDIHDLQGRRIEFALS
jgi:hypothetical protein